MVRFTSVCDSPLRAKAVLSAACIMVLLSRGRSAWCVHGGLCFIDRLSV
jgi:hypothetical protein